MDFIVKPYKSRTFAVYDGANLVAVTVYKKGAREVVRCLVAKEEHIKVLEAEIKRLSGQISLSANAQNE